MAKFPRWVSPFLPTLLVVGVVGCGNLVESWSSSNSSHPYDPFYHNTSSSCNPTLPTGLLPIYKDDFDQLQFPQNIEHFEADFFLWASLGYGLDVAAPELVFGGPPPIGPRKANLDSFVRGIIREFAFEEIGHLRVLKNTFGGIARPLMDMRAEAFAKFVDEAFGYKLDPPFDPYRDSLSCMMASYFVPYVGLTGYVGTAPTVAGYVTKRVLAGLLGVEAGQDSVIRMYLYERRNETMHPYNFTVADFTNKVSILRNNLGGCGLRDEGVVVPLELGPEGNSTTNVLASNQDSISYSRTPAEILRIVYRTGNEHVPGGFYPKGANGRIARAYLDAPTN